ncbi:MAG: hypothetical protein P1P90_04310 [Patescibacteria group bacterium]|nr:hypothetical protein [Patescibacteria group bacterium]
MPSSKADDIKNMFILDIRKFTLGTKAVAETLFNIANMYALSTEDEAKRLTRQVEKKYPEIDQKTATQSDPLFVEVQLAKLSTIFFRASAKKFANADFSEFDEIDFNLDEFHSKPYTHNIDPVSVAQFIAWCYAKLLIKSIRSSCPFTYKLLSHEPKHRTVKIIISDLPQIINQAIIAYLDIKERDKFHFIHIPFTGSKESLEKSRFLNFFEGARIIHFQTILEVIDKNSTYVLINPTASDKERLSESGLQKQFLVISNSEGTRYFSHKDGAFREIPDCPFSN